jgi:hypothetical protein
MPLPAARFSHFRALPGNVNRVRSDPIDGYSGTRFDLVSASAHRTWVASKRVSETLPLRPLCAGLLEIGHAACRSRTEKELR